MKKTNLEIEIECTQNWIENYILSGESEKLISMRKHLRDLKRRQKRG